MPGFNNLSDYCNAIDLGREHYSSFYKLPTVNITSMHWFDMSMSSGNPNPQYYAATPLIAQQMKRSVQGGLNHGPSVESLGYDKFLKRFLIMSNQQPSPMGLVLADYLLYYPFVDMGTNDPQVMTNSTTLPRYTTGEGVQMMLVSVAPGSGLAPTFQISYTNSAGVSGRTSRAGKLGFATVNGSILSSETGLGTNAYPFVGLQDGDKGVRSVESVTLTSGTDVGLFALVLVRPLMTTCIYEATAPVEVNLLADQSILPQIYDDAFLNIMIQPQGTISGVRFTGEIETIWN